MIFRIYVHFILTFNYLLYYQTVSCPLLWQPLGGNI